MAKIKHSKYACVIYINQIYKITRWQRLNIQNMPVLPLEFLRLVCIPILFVSSLLSHVAGKSKVSHLP